MAALIRLVFMFVLVVFVVVVMIIIVVIIVVMFMERAFVFVQCLVYDNANRRRACVSMVMMVHLESQSGFAFLDALQVETPATAGVYIKNFFVADFPTQGMFVICRGLHFFLVVVKECDDMVFVEPVL